MPFICKCQKIYKVNDKTFKFKLHFDSYKSSTNCQRNKKYKNYIQLDQLNTIKRTKSTLKRNVKMLGLGLPTKFYNLKIAKITPAHKKD